MEIIKLSAATPLPAPCAATIGFFDGVHRGHRYLIRHVMDVARDEGLESAVVTFDRHPRQVIHTDFRPRLLSTPDEKAALLSQTGVERCVVLPFDAQMASLSAREFMQDVLLAHLNVRKLVIGYDNRFGHNRSEGFADYAAYGREMGIEVEQWQPLEMDSVCISSSVVRSLLLSGEVGMAARCLGYPYTIAGTVEHGRNVGTQIGFPTANLRPGDPSKLIPGGGVYAVDVRLGGGAQVLPAMLNIGCRPTFDGTDVTIETHIIDFSGELYGCSMSVSFVARLRDERKFRSAAELSNQLRRDLSEAERLLTARRATQHTNHP